MTRKLELTVGIYQLRFVDYEDAPTTVEVRTEQEGAVSVVASFDVERDLPDVLAFMEAARRMGGVPRT